MDVQPSTRPSYSWRWIALLWFGFALVNATQIVAGMRAVGMQHPWWRLFFTVLATWIVWPLATPLVLRLGRRCPFAQWRSLRTWSIHLAACIAIGAVCSLWAAGLQMLLQPWGYVLVTQFGKTAFSAFYGEFHLFLILYAAILALDYTLESKRRLAQRETEAARLSGQLSRAQLAALRRQLEPHFFFNTLNAIAGLVREKRNDDAVSMIAGLSDLLRRVLDDSGKQEVSLGEEMEFLETYLEIQKTRFAERLRLSVDVPKEFLSARVPSLILQPMVENAIEHGIEKRAAGGLLRIGAVRDNGFLTLSVYNEGPRIPDDWERRLAGVGIANVRSRLNTLYGASGKLNIQNRDQAFGSVQTQMSFEADPVRIRALVVDDEPLARSNILHLLRACPDIEILGECDSATAALDAIRKQKPDLVFLDVRMPEYDGLDVLEMLGADAPPAVIFVTAYDQYALKAFDTGALDYLLKPFNNARFARALERAKERIARRPQTPAKLDRLTIKSAGSVIFLPVRDVDWIEAADYYASLHVGKKTHLLRRSMNDLESDLDTAQFCRIHRSTIVNLDRVRELRFDSDAEYELVLADGTTLRLSRRYRKDLQARLGQAVDVKVPL